MTTNKNLSISNSTLINIIFALLGILTTISLTLAGAALKWSFDANAELKQISKLTEQVDIIDMQTKIDTLYNNIKDNNYDDKQNSSISKHWQLLGWTRDQINELRAKNSLDLVSWPELNNPKDTNEQ